MGDLESLRFKQNIEVLMLACERVEKLERESLCQAYAVSHLQSKLINEKARVYEENEKIRISIFKESVFIDVNFSDLHKLPFKQIGEALKKGGELMVVSDRDIAKTI